jgi:cell wall-associated NlpC family hydrolase
MAAVFPELNPMVLPITEEKEKEQRLAVIEQAMRFKGTPYREQADQPGVGVDCAMLLVRAWVDAGVFRSFDPRPYPTQWHLHQDQERYLEQMSLSAKEVDTPRPGDLVLFKFGRTFSHSGIYIGDDKIIHAFLNGRCSREEIWSSRLARYRNGSPRPRKFFDVWAHIRERTQ